MGRAYTVKMLDVGMGIIFLICVGLGIMVYWQYWARIRLILCRPVCVGIDLAGVNLSHTQFMRVSISKVNLSEIDLRLANLSRANLTGVDFREADLFRARLYGANLQNANLRGGKLENVDLRKVIINDETQLDDKWRLVWEIVNQKAMDRDLQKMDLSEVDLSLVDLRNANLSQANL